MTSVTSNSVNISFQISFQPKNPVCHRAHPTKGPSQKAFFRATVMFLLPLRAKATSLPRWKTGHPQDHHCLSSQSSQPEDYPWEGRVKKWTLQEPLCRENKPLKWLLLSSKPQQDQISKSSLMRRKMCPLKSGTSTCFECVKQIMLDKCDKESQIDWEMEHLYLFGTAE